MLNIGTIIKQMDQTLKLTPSIATISVFLVLLEVGIVSYIWSQSHLGIAAAVFTFIYWALCLKNIVRSIWHYGSEISYPRWRVVWLVLLGIAEIVFIGFMAFA